MRTNRPGAALLGTVIYMVVVAVVLVLPTSAPHSRRGYLSEYHLPLGRRLIADVAVNIAIFVPIGWGLRRAGRRWSSGPALLAAAIAVAAGFSLAMETVQFWLAYRYSSIIDVATNSLGAALGAWAEARAGRA